MNVMLHFQEGGVFMYCILLLGVFTFAIIAERIRALYLHRKLVPVTFRSQLLEFLRRGDFTGAQQFTRSLPRGHESLVKIIEMACYLKGNAAAEEELQSRMDEALSAEIAGIDRRTGFLAMAGNVATLLGLLGTITGMIQSFSAVASANAADRAILLSRGISEAMNCTAFGLIVAIPGLVAYALFQNKTDRIVTSLTENITKIYHDLIFLVSPDTKDVRA